MYLSVIINSGPCGMVTRWIYSQNITLNIFSLKLKISWVILVESRTR